MLKKSKAKILIVDDETEIVESLSQILTEEGYSCDAAYTGLEAIDKAKATFFDVALVDIRLPDMEGTDLISQINENNPKLIKIMVTGYPEVENTIVSLNKGVHGFVVKPLNPDKLLDMIEKKLKNRDQSEEITEDKLVDWVKSRVKKLSDTDHEVESSSKL